MALRLKLFGSSKVAAPAAAEQVCRHATLKPMWENVSDMGAKDKVSRYKCEDCGHFLSVAEARPLL